MEFMGGGAGGGGMVFLIKGLEPSNESLASRPLRRGWSISCKPGTFNGTVTQPRARTLEGYVRLLHVKVMMPNVL